jgi:protein O-GlcNAc transferase
MANSQHELQRAGAALRNGQPKTAIGICEKLLTDRPRHFEARHLRGRCWAALGRWEDAVTDFRRVLSDQGDFFPAWVDLGISEALRGNFEDARGVLERALVMDSRPAEVHFGLGLCALQAGDHPRAISAFRSAIERNPRFPDAFNNMGVAHDRLGELTQAVECFRYAIALHPDHADALRNLGDALLRSGNAADAVDAFRRAARLRPQEAAAHAELGASELSAGDLPAARHSLTRALELDGRLVTAAVHLGEALRLQEDFAGATAAFQHALQVDASCAAAHLGLGRLESLLGNAEKARRHFVAAGGGATNDPSIAISLAVELEKAGSAGQALDVLRDASRTRPQNPDVHDAMGALLHRLGKLPEALDCYERALAIDERRLQTWIHSGNALESMGALARAIENFEQGLRLKPADEQCIASIASCAYRLCDWDLAASNLATLRTSADGIDALPAFLLLASDLEPDEIARSQQRRASASHWPTAPAMPALPALRPRERLRVAYVSPDFGTHPVAYAIAGLIERHDRQRISPIAISLKAADGSPIGARLRAAFDEFIDVSGRSDQDAVRLMREREVDIAIDLAGPTSGARPSIFAMRAAPLQLNYLGYPGSTGMNFMDFIVADDFVVPPADENLYAERVVRMPGSYLPFDDSRLIGDDRVERESAGLPPSGFVFCAFTSPFKITRPVFAIWMDLLREIEGSVLWLRGVGAETAGNLRRAARESGVDPNRLLFAVNLESMSAHLSRLRLADLYLDTVPYNAHTTAAEALWAGVPVITCVGKNFAGRVGASLLAACGLNTLICRDLAAYRSAALGIARTPGLHQELRDHLRNLGSSAIAFDTGRYTRDFEELLFQMHRTSVDGARV